MNNALGAAPAGCESGSLGGILGFLTVPPLVLDALNQEKTFIIVGHEKPDADCLCSQLALHSLLQRLGKTSFICSRGPFEKQEIANFSNFFHLEVPREALEQRALVVVLDCGSLERTGFSSQLPGLPVVIIDHHSNSEAVGDLFYLDTFSPSTTLLVQQLIEAIAPPVTLEEASHIFRGFASDTGYFRFLEQSHGAVFPLIGRLLDAGVSPRMLQRLWAGKQPFASRMQLGRLLLRTRSFHRNRLRLTYELAGDVGPDQTRDSAQLYSLLLDSLDTEIMVHLRQEGKGWNISFRSHRSNVGQLAHSWGGGGHKHAAGCRLDEGELEQVIERLVAATAALLEDL